LDQNSINQKFKQVSDEVEKMASQMDEDTKNKVAAIRDDAAKKFSSIITSK
jgi:ElaB/YqjD/DUF883 family membrane-anchored ribosome-binding protein